ncbi:MAG: hypothetical protein LC808_23045 [Actinobacteria bacterium]|nr:hypothetical protein [Actinomycetota bacterium]
MATISGRAPASRFSRDEIHEYMDPAYVVRITDAFADEASTRVHDGVNLVHV